MNTLPAQPTEFHSQWTDRILQRWRIAKVRAHLRPGTRLLDVGCADAALFRTLGDDLGEGVGIDAALRQPYFGARFRIYPGYFPKDLPETGKFDAVTLMAVLEHVPPEQKPALVQACAQLLNPGGRVIITVPSPRGDLILVVLKFLRLVAAETLCQHHGFKPADTEPLFVQHGFRLVCRRRFQLGLNNVFVFEK